MITSKRGLDPRAGPWTARHKSLKCWTPGWTWMGTFQISSSEIYILHEALVWNRIWSLWNILFIQFETKGRKKVPTICQESFHSLENFIWILLKREAGERGVEKKHQICNSCCCSGHESPQKAKDSNNSTSKDLSSKTAEEGKRKVDGGGHLDKGRGDDGPTRTQPGRHSQNSEISNK